MVGALMPLAGQYLPVGEIVTLELDAGQYAPRVQRNGVAMVDAAGQ